MLVNETKAKLKAGGTVYGCFVRYDSATLIEIIGYNSWDFIVFDGEHGTIQPADVENLVRAAELRHVTPIVRVPTNQPATILRYMDTGVQGLHVPWVESGADAEAVVQAVKYQPRGRRGLAGIRAADFGQGASLAEYVGQANRETLVIVHIESRAAVEQIDAIAAVDDIDVVFLGPTDLSNSYGKPGQPGDPTVQAAMQHVIEVVAESDAVIGTMIRTADEARQWRERGARYITIGFESLLMPAMKTFLSGVRD